MAFVKGSAPRNTGRTHFKKGFTPWNKGITYSDDMKQGMKRGGISTEIKLCVDCGKEVYWTSTRCAPCRYRFARGDNGANYKGTLPKCVDCGQQLDRKTSIRCEPCYKKFAVGVNAPMYGKHFTGERSPGWKGGLTLHPLYNKMAKNKRRMRSKLGGELNIKTVQLVYEDNIKRYGTLTCYLCEIPIEFKKDNLEHKTPLCRGGTNEYNNLAVACKSCNSRKHGKTEEEYRRVIQSQTS